MLQFIIARIGKCRPLKSLIMKLRKQAFLRLTNCLRGQRSQREKGLWSGEVQYRLQKFGEIPVEIAGRINSPVIPAHPRIEA